jgi:hypothetical protein
MRAIDAREVARKGTEGRLTGSVLVPDIGSQANARGRQMRAPAPKRVAICPGGVSNDKKRKYPQVAVV